ncbi:hypothetical protein KC354_g6633 [Hortaea werneckii]|nr:hypothetical protein KC354_g6633 [Hortaea werneckii]
MASGGHEMLQQKPALEAKIKTLVNSDLKEICRAYNQNVSGTKALLQGRCLEVLNDIIRTGDVRAFEDLKHRAQYKGQPLAADATSGTSASNYNSTPASMKMHGVGGGRLGGGPGLNRFGGGGRPFKSSPFYEIIETVLPLQELPVGAEMPQNRHTVKNTINLNAEQCSRIANDGMRLLLYCGVTASMNPYQTVDVAFPNQIEVKVNGDDVKANFKGLKNKPGSTKPADLTDRFRTRPVGYDNQITLTYALTTKRYSYMIYLVRHIKSNTLAERIKQQSVIPKQRVIDELCKANEDPDIEATSTRMSLKDPISTVRISLPVRSTVCTHMQCFDGTMFLEMMEQAPLWNCPICNKTVSFQSLCIDKYFQDILHNTPGSIEKVDVEPNGEWKVIKEEEEEQANGTSNKPRASYDDDFDDDLVEVSEVPKAVNGLKAESQPPVANRSPMPGAFNTPPLTSREPSVAQSAASANRPNKRPSGAVIDLTLSDDEEEQPPRPAKRTAPNPSRSEGNANSSNSYNTPASLPDRHRDPYAPPAPQQAMYQPPVSFPLAPSTNSASSFRGTDNYRPNNYPQRQPSIDGGSTRGTQSPATRPTLSGLGAAGWGPTVAQPTRPSIQPPSNYSGPQSFSIRPPQSPGGPQSPASGRQSAGSVGGPRLPPINLDAWGGWQTPSNQNRNEGGWRGSDRGGSYSHSPS